MEDFICKFKGCQESGLSYCRGCKVAVCREHKLCEHSYTWCLLENFTQPSDLMLIVKDLLTKWGGVQSRNCVCSGSNLADARVKSLNEIAESLETASLNRSVLVLEPSLVKESKIVMDNIQLFNENDLCRRVVAPILPLPIVVNNITKVLDGEDALQVIEKPNERVPLTASLASRLERIT